MDRGAWQATVHGVTKSGTRLRTTKTSIHCSNNRVCFRNSKWHNGERSPRGRPECIFRPVMFRSSSGCYEAWLKSLSAAAHVFLVDGTCPARGCALLIKSSCSPASPALWKGSFAEMNDLFPKWFLCDSCAHGGGKGFRETPHDLRQLPSPVQGWEVPAPARWCWQEAGTGGAWWGC